MIQLSRKTRTKNEEGDAIRYENKAYVCIGDGCRVYRNARKEKAKWGNADAIILFYEKYLSEPIHLVILIIEINILYAIFVYSINTDCDLLLNARTSMTSCTQVFPASLVLLLCSPDFCNGGSSDAAKYRIQLSKICIVVSELLVFATFDMLDRHHFDKKQATLYKHDHSQY